MSSYAPSRSFILACFVSTALALFGSACAPEIGDECHTALDCSVSATRVCDRTQPHGYCTLQGCEEGSCPKEAVCVKFRPTVDRLATTYCMAKCDDSSDCRDGSGYECLRAMPTSPNMSLSRTFGDGIDAEILGKSSQKFCAVRSPLPSETEADAGVDSGK